MSRLTDAELLDALAYRFSEWVNKLDPRPASVDLDDIEDFLLAVIAEPLNAFIADTIEREKGK